MSFASQLFDLDINEAIPASNIRYGDGGISGFYRAHKKGIVITSLIAVIALGLYAWKKHDDKK